MWDTFPAWVRKKSYKTKEKKCDYQGREHIRIRNDYGNPLERMEQWRHGDGSSELCIWEILTEIPKKYKYRPDIHWWSTITLCCLYHPYSADVCIQIHSCVWIWMYCDMQHVWRSEDNAGYWSLPFILFAVWSIFLFCLCLLESTYLWASGDSACLSLPQALCSSARITDAYHHTYVRSGELYLVSSSLVWQMLYQLSLLPDPYKYLIVQNICLFSIFPLEQSRKQKRLHRQFSEEKNEFLECSNQKVVYLTQRRKLLYHIA